MVGTGRGQGCGYHHWIFLFGLWALGRGTPRGKSMCLKNQGKGIEVTLSMESYDMFILLHIRYILGIWCFMPI